MLAVPTAMAALAYVAVLVLPVPESVPVPRVVAPFLKVTVPVGAYPTTVAVNVTLAPDVEGFKLDATAVVVAILLTV